LAVGKMHELTKTCSSRPYQVVRNIARANKIDVDVNNGPLTRISNARRGISAR
jgi:hypothetical protein